MGLTDLDKLLINLLRYFKASPEDIIAIMLALKTVEKKKTLTMWLVNNEEATTSDILKKTLDIATTS